MKSINQLILLAIATVVVLCSCSPKTALPPARISETPTSIVEIIAIETQPIFTPSKEMTPETSPTRTIPLMDILQSGQYLIVSVTEGSDGITPIDSLLVIGMDGHVYGQLGKYEGFSGTISYKQDQVAYLADGSHIMSFDVKTGERQLLAYLKGLICNSPISWSNDDRFIALSCRGRIYIVSIDTGIVEEITAGTKRNVWVDPIWSPDGRQIAFDHLPGFPKSSPEEGLYIVNTSCLQDTSTCMNLAQGPLEGSFLCPECMDWSPDGRFLAFIELGKIKVLDSETAQIREIKIPEADYDPESLAWSPDGNWIAYTLLKVIDNDPQVEVFLVSVDGERFVPLGNIIKDKDKTIAFWIKIP
jgi:WD40 repeat protein